ncbi:hypothetical protein DIS03_10095 [Vibrio cholerae]|nr:hypothetical protein DIS03_10095 [Vibrio cholerae]
MERFYAYLHTEKGLSLYTQRNYKQQLETMTQYLVQVGLTHWTQLDSAWVRQLVMQGKRQGMKASSIATRLSSLRSFLDFLILRGELQANPAKGVSAPRKQRTLPKNLDVDEMAQLLEVTDDDPLSIRDRAIMELMYGAGLRLAELVSIDIKDVNLSEGEIRVIGKGNKERKVWFAGQAQEWSVNGSNCAVNWRIAQKRRCLCPNSVPVFHTVVCKNAWPNGAKNRRLPVISAHINCATRLPPICWNRAITCVRCRSYLGTRTSRQRKSIPTSIFNIWLRCMTKRILGRAKRIRMTNHAVLPPIGFDSSTDV